MASGNPTRRAVAAGVICGLFGYLPAAVFNFVPVRGTLFCLFGGIARRSLKRGIFGLIVGAVTDILFHIAWLRYGPEWDPRFVYNVLLHAHLPPHQDAVTHHGDPAWASFGVGFVAWLAVMFALWWPLWGRKLNVARWLMSWLAALAVAALAATLLWQVMPMEHAWLVEAIPRYRTNWYLPLFLIVLPACGGLYAWLLAGWAARRD